MARKPIPVRLLVFMSLCVGVNIAGSFAALALRLPVYLDTTGTLLSAILLGPLCGALTGSATALVSAAAYDPVSLYYLPVQMLLGLLTGLFFREHRFNGWRSVCAVLVITLAASALATLITAFVFGGVTSSGSSYIVAALKAGGMSVLSAVFSTQIFSDLADKGLSFALAFTLIAAVPKRQRAALLQERALLRAQTAGARKES